MVGSRRDRSRAAVAICDNERLLLQRSDEQRSAEQRSAEQHSDEQRMTSMASMRQMLDSVAMDDTSMSSARRARRRDRSRAAVVICDDCDWDALYQQLLLIIRKSTYKFLA